MFLALTALMAAQSYWDDPAPKGFWAKPTRELAQELLPPEWTADAVSHVVGRGILQGGPPFSVRFEGRPAKTVDGFCLRNSYHVSNFRTTAPGEFKPSTKVKGIQIRLGGCSGIFAHVNPRAAVLGAKSALRWLEWAQSEAQSERPLPVEIRCTDETSGARCAGGPRAVLASLPIGNSFIVSDPSYDPHVWKIAITETKPGDLLWDVTVDATPGTSSIHMTWKVPAPF